MIKLIRLIISLLVSRLFRLILQCCRSLGRSFVDKLTVIDDAIDPSLQRGEFSGKIEEIPVPSECRMMEIKKVKNKKT